MVNHTARLGEKRQGTMTGFRELLIIDPESTYNLGEDSRAIFYSP